MDLLVQPGEGWTGDRGQGKGVVSIGERDSSTGVV